jgi:hypothetical protein
MHSKTEPVGVPTASANHHHIFEQKRYEIVLSFSGPIGVPFA